MRTMGLQIYYKKMKFANDFVRKWINYSKKLLSLQSNSFNYGRKS